MIVVLGSGGQVGRSLKLIKPKHIKACFLNKKKCDITNFQILESHIKNKKPKFVINLAAYTNVTKAEIYKKDAKNVNSKSVKNLSLLSNKYNFIFLHISTDYVFNGKNKKNYNEKNIPDPISYYGKSKLLGENHIIKNSKKYIIIRTSGIYSHYESSFLYKILYKAKNNKEIYIVSDQICYPTYAFDLAKLLWNIVSKEKNLSLNEIYHFSGHENALSWFDFAKKTFKYAKKYNSFLPTIKKINAMDYKDKVKRPINSCLSNKKINKIFINKTNINKNIKESVDLFYKYNSQ